jgi:hypothetical protein
MMSQHSCERRQSRAFARSQESVQRRCTNTPASVETPHPAPEQVLAERLAREIDEEDHQSRLAILRKRLRPPCTTQPVGSWQP